MLCVTGSVRPPRRLTGWWSAGGALLALALVVELAPALGLQRLPVVAALLAPRNLLTAVLAGAGLLLLAVAVAARGSRRALLPLGLASAVAATCGIPAVLAHGLTDEAPASRAPGDLRILSWNINGNLVRPSAVAALAAREQADIVVLPEITAGFDGDRYAGAFQAAGLDLVPYPPISVDPVQAVVFVARRLGSYGPAVRHSPEPERSAAITPETASLPRIVAIHALKPLPGHTGAWDADLDWVAGLCADPATIAVGDFNATVDHFSSGRLGGCRDAAAARGAASVGTWPTALPPWAAMPIDHVLLGSAWSPRSFTVLTDADGSGARHRPILAVVARAGA
jgi:endonuclease/exonuclease/phosphatase (EEP) superfamily protein YafD